MVHQGILLIGRKRDDFAKKKNKFIRSLFFGGLSILFSVFITLYITPRVITTVGIDAYGFVSLSSNIISYLQIATIALNAYAARYISISYLQKRTNEFNGYFNTVLWGNLGLGTVILVFFIIFTRFIDSFLNVPEELLWDVQILFLCVGINFFIGLISVAWKVFGQIKDRVDILNILDSASYILQIVVLFVAYNFLPPHVWYIGFTHLFAALFTLASAVLLTRHYLPELQVKANRFSKIAFRTLVVKGLWNSIDGLGNTLNSGLDLLITDLMLSPIDMGKVSVAKSIMALTVRCYTMVSQIFHPRFISAYANHDTSLLVGHYIKAIKTCSIITNMVFACFLFLGSDFIRLWIPKQDVNTIFNLTVLCMIPGVVEGMTCPLYSIYTLTTKLKLPTIITIISGLTNVLSMFILLKFTSLGVYAIVITTAVIVTLAHWITPFYSCKCLRISISSFIPTIGLCFAELGINISVVFFVGKLLMPVQSWFTFIINGAILGTTSLASGVAFLWMTQRIESRKER